MQKLESALDSVEEAYGKMIERVEKREAEEGDVNGDSAVEEASTSTSTPRVRKRKVIDEDEDEDEDEAGVGVEDTGEQGERVVAVNGHKKARAE